MCEFGISRMPDGAGLKLCGELDVATAPQLRAELRELPAGSPVTLDLTGLTFVDSTGIHAILTFARSLNGAGPLVLLQPTDGVARVFEILGLHGHSAIEIRRTSRPHAIEKG